MKIRKRFERAAVMALSVIPAMTALAAGNIGTISYTHTYDGAGNAMRYNSSANIGSHTAGGTDEYKYCMYVDGETASCIEQAALSEMFNDAQHITSNRRGNQRGIRKESGRETAKSGEKTEKAIIQTTV